MYDMNEMEIKGIKHGIALCDITWHLAEVCNWSLKWGPRSNLIIKIAILLYQIGTMPPCQRLPWLMFFFFVCFFLRLLLGFPCHSYFFNVTTLWVVAQSLKGSLQDCALTKSVFQGLKKSTGEPSCIRQFFLAWDFPEPSETYQEHSSKPAISVGLRDWTLRVDVTCSITAPPATSPNNLLPRKLHIYSTKTDTLTWALPLCVFWVCTMKQKKKARLKPPAA